MKEDIEEYVRLTTYEDLGKEDLEGMTAIAAGDSPPAKIHKKKYHESPTKLYGRSEGSFETSEAEKALRLANIEFQDAQIRLAAAQAAAQSKRKGSPTKIPQPKIPQPADRRKPSTNISLD